jgi:alpha-tubulin suppressor-like RCC1 family protein
MQVMTGVSSVSSGSGGYGYTMIVKTDGTLWGTGYNGSGQLGAGTSTNIFLTPVQVMTGVSSVSSGSDHTMILKTDGTLWATGYNSDGQLGTGTTTTSPTVPVRLTSMDPY